MPSVYLVKIENGGRQELGIRSSRPAARADSPSLTKRAAPAGPISGTDDQLLQHGLNALMLGGTYALLGIGLTLIFGIMSVVNFTHGELYAFGAYMMFALVMPPARTSSSRSRSPSCSGWRSAAAIELVLLRPLRGADIDTTMLVMIGAWIALQNAELLAWTGVAKSIDNPFPAAPLVLGPVSVAWNRVFVFVASPGPHRRDLRCSINEPGWAARCAPPSRTATRRR